MGEAGEETLEGRVHLIHWPQCAQVYDVGGKGSPGTVAGKHCLQVLSHVGGGRLPQLKRANRNPPLQLHILIRLLEVLVRALDPPSRGAHLELKDVIDVPIKPLGEAEPLPGGIFLTEAPSALDTDFKPSCGRLETHADGRGMLAPTRVLDHLVKLPLVANLAFGLGLQEAEGVVAAVAVELVVVALGHARRQALDLELRRNDAGGIGISAGNVAVAVLVVAVLVVGLLLALISALSGGRWLVRVPLHVPVPLHLQRHVRFLLQRQGLGRQQGPVHPSAEAGPRHKVLGHAHIQEFKGQRLPLRAQLRKLARDLARPVGRRGLAPGSRASRGGRHRKAAATAGAPGAVQVKFRGAGGGRVDLWVVGGRLVEWAGLSFPQSGTPHSPSFPPPPSTSEHLPKGTADAGA